ncbi:Abhydrolase_8 domain containing protein [Streptomyces sp. CBMAI 2042]|nr:Abhydrolase_8 domain containing protein [Streptomyces sp. CBMAI 2042]
MTAIGHSYGSRTVGAATQQGGGIPGVDDIVLVGSPGLGVDRAEDLGIGKDHVFVGAADNDVVTRLPSKEQGLLAAAGRALGPAGSLAVDVVHPGDDDLWFGKDPASEDFGGRRFAVDPGPPLIGLGRVTLDAHSQYFNPKLDSASADSIAMVVAGRGHQVKQEGGR